MQKTQITNHIETKRAKSKKIILYILIAVLIMSALLVSVYYAFDNFLGNYEASVAVESAAHLVEITGQIKLYIEEKVNIRYCCSRGLGEVKSPGWNGRTLIWTNGRSALSGLIWM